MQNSSINHIIITLSQAQPFFATCSAKKSLFTQEINLEIVTSKRLKILEILQVSC